MILDTSAIVAILLREPGFEGLLGKIEQAPVVAVGTPTLTECSMVLSSRLRVDARLVIRSVLMRINARVIPFTEEHFDAAADAFLRFGRGRHPAALNFGDCLSYAMASVSGLPLLYTGNGFSRTDIPAA
ncbi:MAG: type II toxin-antitoxin system VapC family toxin [Bryobacteraceae bacterium]